MTIDAGSRLAAASDFRGRLCQLVPAPPANGDSPAVPGEHNRRGQSNPVRSARDGHDRPLSLVIGHDASSHLASRNDCKSVGLTKGSPGDTLSSLPSNSHLPSSSTKPKR